MADNIALSNVAGTPSVATRDVSSVHYQKTEHHAGTTATRTQVADNAASVTLLNANTGRLGAIITNDSSARLYVGLGATAATTTNYSFFLDQGETWHMPYLMYSGAIVGIWATDPGDGAARVTEITS